MSSYKVVCCCTVTTPNSSVILALGFTFKTSFWVKADELIVYPLESTDYTITWPVWG